MRVPFRYRDFAPLDSLPANWTDAWQAFESTMESNFRLIIKPTDNTVLQVPAATGNDLVGITIQGNPRYIEASIERASLGGGTARDMDVWVTSTANSFTPASPGEIDNTNYVFALAITETGGTPGGVAIKRKIGTAHWDGTKFTSVSPLIGMPSPQSIGAALATDLTAEIALRVAGDTNNPTVGQKAALAGSSGTPSDVNRYVTQSDPLLGSGSPTGAAGGDLSGTFPNPQIAAGVIVNGDVAPAAAIAESKLALASDAAAGTASRRTLGTGATQAMAGNDARVQTLTGTAAALPLPGTFGRRYYATDLGLEFFDTGTIWAPLGIPIGGGFEWFGSADPTDNIVICDGRALSRTTYAGLFAQLGTAFGVGNGSTTFNIANMIGRFPFGSDGTTGRGATVGAKTLALVAANLPAHAHTTPNHSHGMDGLTRINAVAWPNGGFSGVTPLSDGGGSGSPGIAANASSGGSSNTGTGTGLSGTAFDKMPPAVGVNFAIRIR